MSGRLLSPTILLLFIATVYSENPGITIKLENGGLEFGKDMILSLLKEALHERSLPDINGAVPVNPYDPLSPDLHYFLSNVKILNFTVPNDKVSLTTTADQGLRLTASHVRIELGATYHFQLGWFPIGKDGDLEAVATDIALDVVVGVRGVASHLQLKDHLLDVRVGSLAMTFQGDLVDTILNMVQGSFSGDIREAIENVTTVAGKEVIDGPINNMLQSVNVTRHIGAGFFVDLGLTSDPKLQHGSIELDVRGEIFRGRSVFEHPPSTLPSRPKDDDAMFVVEMSDYVLRTAASAAFDTDFLKLLVTQEWLESVAAGYGQYLNTSCDTICVGSLIGPIGKAYPDQSVDVELWATQAPKATIDAKGVHVLLAAAVKLTLPVSESLSKHLVTVTVETQANIKNILIDADNVEVSKLHFAVHMTNSHLKLVSTSLEKIKEKSLQSLWNFAVSLGLESTLNQKGKAGVPLPELPFVQLSKPLIQTLPQSIIFKTSFSLK